MSLDNPIIPNLLSVWLFDNKKPPLLRRGGLSIFNQNSLILYQMIELLLLVVQHDFSDFIHVFSNFFISQVIVWILECKAVSH